MTQGNKEVISESNLNHRGRALLCRKPFPVTREWRDFLTTAVFQKHRAGLPQVTSPVRASLFCKVRLE